MLKLAPQSVPPHAAHALHALRWKLGWIWSCVRPRPSLRLLPALFAILYSQFSILNSSFTQSASSPRFRVPTQAVETGGSPTSSLSPAPHALSGARFRAVVNVGRTADDEKFTARFTLREGFIPTLDFTAPLTIVTSAVRIGVLDEPYADTFAAAHGVPPYRWCIKTGALPAGLALDDVTGALSGVPTRFGAFPIVVQATDSSSPTQTAERPFTLTVLGRNGVLVNPGLERPYNLSDHGPVADGWTEFTWPGFDPPDFGESSFHVEGDSSQAVVSSFPSRGGIRQVISVTPGVPFTAAVQAVLSGNETGDSNVQIGLAVAEGDTADPTAAVATDFKWDQDLEPFFLWTSFRVTFTPTQPTVTVFLVAWNVYPFSTTVRFDAAFPTPPPAPLEIVTESLPDGVVNEPYSHVLAAAGGIPPYFWTRTAGFLPNNVVLNFPDEIEGIPTTPGTAAFTLEVRDSASPPKTARRSFALAVRAVNGGLANAGLNTPYLAAAGGEVASGWTGFAWPGFDAPAFARESTALLEGDSSQRMSGTGAWRGGVRQVVAVVPGARLTVRASAIAASGAGGTGQVELGVGLADGATDDPAQIAASDLRTDAQADLTRWTEFETSFIPVGDKATVFLVAGSVAAGPVDALFDAASPAEVPAPLSIATVSLPDGVVGEAYAAALEAAGGTPPFRWSQNTLSGPFPPELNVDEASGELTGTPGTAGAVELVIRVGDSGSPPQEASRPYTITVYETPPFTIANVSPLPRAVAGLQYREQLQTANGDPPIVWCIVAGSPPPGIYLNANTGEILGVATEPGTFVFTVHAADSALPARSASKEFELTVDPSPGSAEIRLVRLVPLSGDGQKGLTSMPYAEPLIWKALDAATGEPLEGVLMDFSFIEGEGGRFVKAPDFSAVSDAQGRAGISVIAGPAPQERLVVEVRLIPPPEKEVEPIRFVLSSDLPKLDLVHRDFGPKVEPVRTNCGQGRLGPAPADDEETIYQKEAVSRILGLRIFDAEERPAPNIEVRPILVDLATGLPTAPEGIIEFMPTAAVTDAEGLAFFATIVGPAALPQTRLRVRFETVQFEALDHTPLGCDWTVEVGDPKFQTTFLQSGQGQIALPGMDVPEPLRVFKPRKGKEKSVTINFCATQPGDRFEVVEGELKFSSKTEPHNVDVETATGYAAVRLHLGLVPLPRTVVTCGYSDSAIFAVGPPEVRLARRAFQRDDDGRILRDGTGNPLYKSDGDPYEYIGFGAPDPFVRRGRAFSFTTPVDADPANEFYVEANAPNLGPEIISRLEALDELQKPLSTDRALAPVKPNIPVVRADSVRGFEGEERYVRYRSGSVVMTVSRTEPNGPTPSPVFVTPSGQRIIQGQHRGQIRPHLLVPMAGGENEVKGPAPEGRSWVWVSLGDSVTNGTYGVNVVGEHQRTAYPVTLARHLDLEFNIAELEEPGVPPRIWLPDFSYIDNPKTLPPSSSPARIWRTATMFLEGAAFPTKPGGRDPLFGRPAFIHNFAVDGFELRSVTRMGNMLGVPLGFDRRSGRNFQIIQMPFREEVVAGFEAIDYTKIEENSELWVVKHVLVSGASTNPAPKLDRTQLSMAIASKPDLVILWTCNNDGLQSVLWGLTSQAFLTPPDTFNVDKHESELASLQPIRTQLQLTHLPSLFDKSAREEALQQVGEFAFIPRYTDHLARLSLALPDADVVMPEMMSVDALPILYDLGDGPGNTIRASIEARINKYPALAAEMPRKGGKLILLPYNIDFFGHDITDHFLDIRLGRRVVRLANAGEPDENGEVVTKNVHLPGSKVSFAVVGARLARRAKLFFKEQFQLSEESFGSKVASGVTHPGLIAGDPAIRRFIFEKLGSGDPADVKWQQFVNTVFVTREFEFRADETLAPPKLKQVADTISEYNTAIRTLAAQGSGRRILFPSNDLFVRIATVDGHYTFDMVEGGIRLFPTPAGGVFSFDGAHPSMIGHALIASEIRKVLLAEALRRQGDVGGVAAPDLKPFGSSELNGLFNKDPVIQFTRPPR